MSKRSPFSRGAVGAPAVLISVLWIGLWWCWPHPGQGTGAGTLPPPRVTYSGVMSPATRLHMAPHLFALPSLVGFSPNGSQAEPEPFTDAPERPPRFLARTADWTAAGLLGPIWSGAPEAPPQRSHTPRYVVGPVFAPPADKAARMFHEVAAALQDRSLEVPDLAGGGLATFDKPWQVQVYVDVDEDGCVEHVLLESGCGEAAIDAMVIRELYRAKATPQKGVVTGGHVTVGFGSP